MSEDNAPASVSKPMPAQLDRYAIISELGHGGMGAVYQAYDPHLDRRVAIKVLHLGQSDSSWPSDGTANHHSALRDHLLAEARALARLADPAIVPIFDVGSVEGQIFIAMEMIPGQSLKSWLVSTHPSWPAICDLMLGVARGLATIHRGGLCHLDLKPDNILLRRDGQPVIIDFGLASYACATHDRGVNGEGMVDQPGQIAGTPGYMAPEQYVGKHVGAASDIFALCVCWLEALLGRRLTSASSFAEYQLQSEILADISDIQGVPAWLVRLLKQGLAPSPEARPKNVEALIGEIEAGLQVHRHRATRWTVISASIVALVVAMALPVANKVSATDLRRTELQQAVQRLEAPVLLEGARRGMLMTRLGDAADLWANFEKSFEERRNDIRFALEELEPSTSGGHRAESFECLAGQIAQLETLLHAVTKADRQIARQVQGALSNVPAASTCVNLRRHQRYHDDPSLVDNPTLATEVALARVEIQRINALTAAGAYAEAETRGAALVERSHNLSYDALIADTHDALGRLAMFRSHARASQRHFYLALLHATASNYEAIVASAHPHILYLKSFFLDGAQEPEQSLAESMASIERANWPAAAVAEWYRSKAFFAMSEQSPASCYHLVQASIEWEWRTPEPDHTARCIRLSDEGYCAIIYGENDRAVRHFTRALHYGETVLGPNHPGLFASLYNLGVAENSRGNYARASEYLMRLGHLLEAEEHDVEKRMWYCSEVLVTSLAHRDPDMTRYASVDCEAVLEQQARAQDIRDSSLKPMLAWHEADSGDRMSAHTRLTNYVNDPARGSFANPRQSAFVAEANFYWQEVAVALDDLHLAEALNDVEDEGGAPADEHALLSAKIALLRKDWPAADKYARYAVTLLAQNTTATSGVAKLMQPYFIQGLAAFHQGHEKAAQQRWLAARQAGEDGFGRNAPALAPILLELALLERTPAHEGASMLNEAHRIGRHLHYRPTRSKDYLASRLRLFEASGVGVAPEIQRWLLQE